jgi:hypothetical protein
MTDRDTGSRTLLIGALIGAFGAILAACIGLIPTIISLSTSLTSTPVVMTSTFTPSNTPITETPSPTMTPTDFPTLTATPTPVVTDTLTLTLDSTTPVSDVDQYEGTWINVESDPSSDSVKLVVTRIEISKTGNTSADFSVCRAVEGGEEYVQPNPAPASKTAFGLAATNLVIAEFADLRWAIVVQLSGNQLVATVQEYNTDNIVMNSETFQLQKPSPLNFGSMLPCESPEFTQ